MLLGIKIIPASELEPKKQPKEVVLDASVPPLKPPPLDQVVNVRIEVSSSTEPSLQQTRPSLSPIPTIWKQNALNLARQRAQNEGKTVDEILQSMFHMSEQEFVTAHDSESSTTDVFRNKILMKRPETSGDLKWSKPSVTVAPPVSLRSVDAIVSTPSLTSAPPTETDLNKLTAKALKASMMGDKETEDKINLEIEQLRSQMGVKRPETMVILPEVDSRGGKFQKTDENSSLSDLLHEEKTSRGNRDYNYVDTYGIHHTDDQYDQIDFKQNKKRSREESKQKQQQINEHQRQKSVSETCKLCYSSPGIKKHLIIALGEKCILSVPYFGSFVKGHCIISPMEHRLAINQCDEEEIREILKFKASLKQMFAKMRMDCVFIETVTDFNMKKQLHAFLECIPVPPDVFDLVPGYFKKALDDSESEWSQNKKVIDTRGKGIVKSIPKDFPYFHVEFTMNGGYAHVIENHRKFPYYFGREVLGDVMDLPKNLLKERQLDEEVERKITFEFCDMYKDFDWTIELEGGDY